MKKIGVVLSGCGVYDGTEINLAGPYPRIHMVDAVKAVTGVDFWAPMTDAEAQALAEKHNVPFTKNMTVGHIINASQHFLNIKDSINLTSDTGKNRLLQ